MFWTTATGVLGRALSLAGGVALARVFGPTDYGAYGMIQSTVGMFGAVSGLGVSLTATKHVAEYRDRNPEAAAQIIALSSSVALIGGAVFAALLFAAARLVAVHALATPSLETPLRLSSVLLFLTNLSGAQAGVLSGFESFRRMAGTSLAGAVISFGTTITGGIGFGLNGAVWGLVAGQGAICLLGHIAVTKTVRERNVPLRLWGGGCSKHLLWSFSVPAALASALVVPTTWACSAMLVKTQGGLPQMGIFNAANQWFGLVIFLPGLLGQALLPVMSERLGCEDEVAFRKMLWISSALNGAIATVLATAVWAGGPLIARLYGRGFEATPDVLTVALITGGLLAVQMPIGQVLVASGRIWTGFWMNLGWSMCFVAGSRFLVHRGAVGLAEARLIAYLMHGIWTGWFALWLLRQRSNRMAVPPARIVDGPN